MFPAPKTYSEKDINSLLQSCLKAVMEALGAMESARPDARYAAEVTAAPVRLSHFLGA